MRLLGLEEDHCNPCLCLLLTMATRHYCNSMSYKVTKNGTSSSHSYLHVFHKCTEHFQICHRHYMTSIVTKPIKIIPHYVHKPWSEDVLDTHLWIVNSISSASDCWSSVTLTFSDPICFKAILSVHKYLNLLAVIIETFHKASVKLACHML